MSSKYDKKVPSHPLYVGCTTMARFNRKTTPTASRLFLYKQRMLVVCPASLNDLRDSEDRAGVTQIANWLVS
jgi:hypothetical protein